MIMVDVVCPDLGKTIDFQLDENVCAWDIAEEIAAMVARSSSRDFTPGENAILLYAMEKQRTIDLNKSLKENGISSGDRLLFI